MNREVKIYSSDLIEALQNIEAYIDFGPHEGDVSPLDKVRDKLRECLDTLPKLNVSGDVVSCLCTCKTLCPIVDGLAKCKCGLTHEFSQSEIKQAKEFVDIGNMFSGLNTR